MGFGCNPFAVFRKFGFIKTVEEALRQGNFETGDIPSVSLEIEEADEESMQAVSGLGKEELKKLAFLALRAKQLEGERTAVSFVGEPEQVERMLEASILAVPIALRQYCTFDTYFHRCNLVATYFWGIGLLERPSNPNLIVVDARSGKVISDFAITPESTYERWVMARIDASDIISIVNFKEFAFALSEWLDEREYDQSLLDSAPPEAVESVFKVGFEQVRKRLLKRLCECLPKVLAHRTLDAVHKRSDSVKIFKKLREGFSASELPELIDALNEAYASQKYRRPQQAELQALGELLNRAEHRKLRLIYTCWIGDWKKLRIMLERMSDEEYCEFVKTSLSCDLVDPLQLIVPNKIRKLLEVCLSIAPTKIQDWAIFVEALLNAGEVKCLAKLADYVHKWSPQEIRRVSKLLRRYPNVPEAFQRALNEALARPKPMNDLKRRLKSMFRLKRKGSD